MSPAPQGNALREQTFPAKQVVCIWSVRLAMPSAGRPGSSLAVGGAIASAYTSAGPPFHLSLSLGILDPCSALSRVCHDTRQTVRIHIPCIVPLTAADDVDTTTRPAVTARLTVHSHPFRNANE